MYTLCQRMVQEGRLIGGILYMKKRWGTPKAVVEEFEANEYVAACWGVGCVYNKANSYEITQGYYDHGNVSHTADHCGNSSNQVIYDYNDDKVGDAMYECGTDGLGDLECIIYKDPNYTDQINVSEVKIDDYIYWTTSSGSRTWHHQGTVTATAEGHPNRS